MVHLLFLLVTVPFLMVIQSINCSDENVSDPGQYRSLLDKIISSSLESNKSSLKLLKKRDIFSGSVGTGFKLMKTQIIDTLETVQAKMKTSLECMPQSVFYNGTCIFISSKHQKMSWKNAERFCRKLPLNTSFVLIQNDHKYAFLRKEIIKLREKENPIDQLVFYIGFNYSKSEWRWINNVSLVQTNFTVGRYFQDWRGSHGDCGSIGLLKTNELIMRSSPCFSTSSRFMCEYNLNPCYMNDICGERGRCVNLFYKFHCECHMFYEGKQCEKINMRGIQTIIGTVVIVILLIFIFCSCDFYVRFFKSCIGIWKCSKEEEEENDEEESGDASKAATATIANVTPPPPPTVQFAPYSIKHSLCKNFKRICGRCLRVFNYNNFSYFILTFITLVLVAVEVIFAHQKFDLIEKLKNDELAKRGCLFMARYYMFEDLVYLPFSLLFIALLYAKLRSNRFNKYIMIKFGNYFKSKLFLEVQENYKKQREEKKRQQEARLRKQACGHCRYYTYKFVTQKFCNLFCCLFCCSCCVPPGSNTRCFVCYCCCLGWKQTTFYKVLHSIQTVVYYIFYYMLCCPMWKCLWNLSKKRREEEKQRVEQEKQRKKEEKRTRLAKKREEALKRKKATLNANEQPTPTTTAELDLDSQLSTDLDIDQDFDYEDYDPSDQTIRNQCPFPSTPFSTSNRAHSAAIYIIYTYDVINIFMTVYTGYVTEITLPLFGDLQTSGVLVMLVVQFIQVLMIGVKFYPILVVADAEPSVLIYFVTMIYLVLIWLFRFLKKSFCSRTNAFISLTIRKVSTQLGGVVRSGIMSRYNASNVVLGLFSDDDNPNEKYISIIKNSVPSIFKEYFGRFRSAVKGGGGGGDDHTRLTDYDYESAIVADLITTTSSYYDGGGGSGSLNVDDYLAATTTTVAPFGGSTVSAGLRSNLKNKTLSGLKKLGNFYYQRDEDFIYLVGILENLPLYITLSYLVVRYSMYFVSSFVEYLRSFMFTANSSGGSSSNQMNGASNGDAENAASAHTAVAIGHDITGDYHLADLLNDLNRKYTGKDLLTDHVYDKQNHNYCYIKKLLDTTDYEASNGVTPDKSYILDKFEKHIYKPVPYMKYSKQYINTYTVAFMVVYFFTLFGFRLSNIFGNALVGTFELIYKIVFRGLLPSFDFNNHNFNAEFRTACLLASLLTTYQLCSSVKKFHTDLGKLHKGEKFFRSLIVKYSNLDYTQMVKKRNKESARIASDSLHFPGYLVAHLVYGYLVLFVGFFLIIIVLKLVFYVEGFWQNGAQILLPLFILFAFKFVVIKCIIKSALIKDNNQRITNLAPYFILSYLNFFFDCFLGLVACLSRVWQTTIVSLVLLPRLDKSMFNSEDDLLLRRLDKGHLAYLNYVRMEHWYNNAVLNGFCEMLIESLFYSQIYRKNIEIYASSEMSYRRNSLTYEGVTGHKMKFEIKRLMSQTDKTREYNVLEHIVDAFPAGAGHFRGGAGHTAADAAVSQHHAAAATTEKKLVRSLSTQPQRATYQMPNIHNLRDECEQQTIKHSNKNFKYTSFLRLRNLLFLCLLLKKNPTLRQYRYHYLKKMKEEEERLSRKKVQSFSDFYAENMKKLNKFKGIFSSKLKVQKGSDSSIGDDISEYTAYSDLKHNHLNIESQTLQLKSQAVMTNLRIETVTPEPKQHRRQHSF